MNFLGDYTSLLRVNSNYRSLWSGEVVSLFGDWFNLIASASLLSSLTSSGFAVGGLFVVRMLAPFLVSPIAGVAADRYNRKWLLIGSDLIRAVIVLGFLWVRDASHVWLLYTLTALQLGISGFFFPARNAILPDLVTRSQLGAANALSSATWSVMLAFGAALGGLVAGQLGIYPAFMIDSATFLISAVMISRIVYQPKIGDETGRTLSAALKQYLDGLRFLRSAPDIFATSLHKGAISLTVNGIYQVLMVVLAEQVFVIGQGGGTSLGLLYAVAGVGTGIGPILARRITGDRDGAMRQFMVISYVLVAVGLAIHIPLASFILVLFGDFLRGLGGGINWVFSTQLLLQNVPDYVRGRVFSTEYALFTLASAAGTFLGGWILDHTDLSLGAFFGMLSLLALLPGMLWAFWIRSRWGSHPPDGT